MADRARLAGLYQLMPWGEWKIFSVKVSAAFADEVMANGVVARKRL